MVGAQDGERVIRRAGWGTAKAENTLEMYTSRHGRKGQISRERSFMR